MSDTDDRISELERDLRARGEEPPALRSDNPDPEAREAEQRKALKDFYVKYAGDMMAKLGIGTAPGEAAEKKGGNK